MPHPRSAGAPDPATLPGDYADLVDLYFLSLRIGRKSPKTILSYWEALRLWCDFLVAHDLPVTIRKNERERQRLRSTIRLFLEDLGHRSHPTRRAPDGTPARLAPATIANRERSLAAFFHWLEEEGHVTRSPMARMEQPRLPKAPPPIVAEGDLVRLVETCLGKDRRGFYARRDLAILLLLIDTGMRRSELGNLAVEDLDTRDGKVLIRNGKGAKTRLIPISDAVCKACKEYLRVRKEYPGATRPLPLDLDQPPLPSVDGGPPAARHPLWLGANGRLTHWGVAYVLEEHCKAAGLPHINPHRLRHTFAHNWLRTEGGMDTLRQMCGWESEEMGHRYGAAGVEARAYEQHARRSLANRITRQVKQR